MSTDSSKPDSARLGIAGRIARAFIDSKLTPLLVITSILLGAAATWLLPREEEPQIKVPMIDVLVIHPGRTARCTASAEDEGRVRRAGCAGATHSRACSSTSASSYLSS